MVVYSVTAAVTTFTVDCTVAAISVVDESMYGKESAQVNFCNQPNLTPSGRQF